MSNEDTSCFQSTFIGLLIHMIESAIAVRTNAQSNECPEGENCKVFVHVCSSASQSRNDMWIIKATLYSECNMQIRCLNKLLTAVQRCRSIQITIIAIVLRV